MRGLCRNRSTETLSDMHNLPGSFAPPEVTNQEKAYLRNLRGMPDHELTAELSEEGTIRYRRLIEDLVLAVSLYMTTEGDSDRLRCAEERMMTATVKAKQALQEHRNHPSPLRSILEKVHVRISAFLDPEGNMPEDTGEFNELKEMLPEIEGVLGMVPASEYLSEHPKA